MCGLTHESTKLLTSFNLLMQLDAVGPEIRLSQAAVGTFIEALDRGEDERAIAELLASSEKAAYFVNDRMVLQLVIRALIRLDGFVHVSPTKLSRAVRLYIDQWGQVTNADLPFIMHILKAAIVIGDEPTIEMISGYLSTHGASFDLAQLSDDSPPLIYAYPVVAHLWAECVVPYPQFLFRPTLPRPTPDPNTEHDAIIQVPHYAPYSAAVALTHPVAIDISNEYRAEISRVALTGAIPETASLVSRLHHRVSEAEHAHQGINQALSEATIEQIRVAQDQIIDEAVKHIAKAAIIRCGL